MLVFFGRQNAGCPCELWSRNFPSDGAGSNFYLRIVADALRFSHVAAGHDVEFVAIFSEPYGRRNTFARLAERGQRNIFLSCDGGRYRASHGKYCSGIEASVCAWIQSSRGIPAGVAGSQVALQIALIL